MDGLQINVPKEVEVQVKKLERVSVDNPYLQSVKKDDSKRKLINKSMERFASIYEDMQIVNQNIAKAETGETNKVYTQMHDLLSNALTRDEYVNLSAKAQAAAIKEKYKLADTSFATNDLKFISIGGKNIENREDDSKPAWTKKTASRHLKNTSIDDLNGMNFEELTTWALLDARINGDSKKQFAPIAEAMRDLYELGVNIRENGLKEKTRLKGYDVDIEVKMAKLQDTVHAYRASHSAKPTFSKGKKRTRLCDILESDAFSALIQKMYADNYSDREHVLEKVDEMKYQEKMNTVINNCSIADVSYNTIILYNHLNNVKSDKNVNTVSEEKELKIYKESYKKLLIPSPADVKAAMQSKKTIPSPANVKAAMQRLKQLSQMSTNDESIEFVESLKMIRAMLITESKYSDKIKDEPGNEVIRDYLLQARDFVEDKFKLNICNSDLNCGILGIDYFKDAEIDELLKSAIKSKNSILKQQEYKGDDAKAKSMQNLKERLGRMYDERKGKLKELENDVKFLNTYKYIELNENGTSREVNPNVGSMETKVLFKNQHNMLTKWKEYSGFDEKYEELDEDEKKNVREERKHAINSMLNNMSEFEEILKHADDMDYLLENLERHIYCINMALALEDSEFTSEAINKELLQEILSEDEGKRKDYENLMELNHMVASLVKYTIKAQGYNWDANNYCTYEQKEEAKEKVEEYVKAIEQELLKLERKFANNG